MGKSHLYVGFVCCTLGLVVGSLLDGNFNRAPAPASLEEGTPPLGAGGELTFVHDPDLATPAFVDFSGERFRVYRFRDRDAAERCRRDAIRAASAEVSAALSQHD